MKLETLSVHGIGSTNVNGALVQPIFQSSTFRYEGAASYDDIRYLRLNNTPNQLSLGETLAALEGGEAGLVTASGMAAISTVVLALVGSGERLLAQDGLYGGTHHFFKENFPELGRSVDFFSPDIDGDWEKLLKPGTRALYVEPISNPLLKIPDLPRIASFARQHGLVSIVDNTFPSPVNFNPIAMGFDVVLHSATKYLNGHSDIVAGCVVAKRETIRKIVPLLNHLGGSLDPHACFLLQRGLKTLPLRVKRQNENALLLARALEKKVGRVIYPGLPSHPGHLRAKEYFRGFGAMICFEYPGEAAATDAFLSRLKLAYFAPSLGGVETLVTRPAGSSHAGVAREDRLRQGISDNLVRVSLGIEHPDDIIADFLEAM